jgi:threonylcarbamoyladenosine tRNA methylthiotransferase MtaB
MPQLPRDVVKNRAAQLREAGGKALSGFLAREVGQTRAVLVEKPGLGRSEQFALVEFEDTEVETGAIIPAEITHTADNRLGGRLLRPTA